MFTKVRITSPNVHNKVCHWMNRYSVNTIYLPWYLLSYPRESLWSNCRQRGRGSHWTFEAAGREPPTWCDIWSHFDLGTFSDTFDSTIAACWDPWLFVYCLSTLECPLRACPWWKCFLNNLWDFCVHAKKIISVCLFTLALSSRTAVQAAQPNHTVRVSVTGTGRQAILAKSRENNIPNKQPLYTVRRPLANLRSVTFVLKIQPNKVYSIEQVGQNKFLTGWRKIQKQKERNIVREWPPHRVVKFN